MAAISRLWQRRPRLRSSRWPTTTATWWSLAAEVGTNMQQACLAEANRLDDPLLAEEIRRHDDGPFPVQDFVQRLNAIEPGAGNRAYRAGMRPRA